MRRVRLRFANLQVEFVDRELALKKIEEWAERGTFPVQVVYGPEGCGKTAWLRQGAELLRELEFDVIYINPVERELVAELGLSSLRDRMINLAREAASQIAWGSVVWSTMDIAREANKNGPEEGGHSRRRRVPSHRPRQGGAVRQGPPRRARAPTRGVRESDHGGRD